MRGLITLVAVGLAAIAASCAPAAEAETATHTYTFSDSLPITYQFCFSEPGCSAPRQAVPYPTQIGVSGVSGHVVNVTVTLHNLALYGGSPNDMELELQGPSGSSLLMTDAGGLTQPQGSDLTFSGGYPPLTDAAVSGTYAPTAGAAPDFPAGPPANPSDLSPYVNQDPNGVWSLWAATTDTLVNGAIGNGWQLNITTTPFANPSPITLNAPAVGAPAVPAEPYPSTLNVSGLSGVVESVRPTLAGLTTNAPDDLDFVLADPAGDGAELMADAGGLSGDSTIASDLAFTFDDAAPSLIPDDTQPFGGTFRPSVYDDGQPAVFPSPAPAAPYPTQLSTLDGRNPNGTWDLFAINDAARADSVLSHGWALDITTRPASEVRLSASAYHATRGQPLTVTVTRGAPASGPATVELATAGGSAVPGHDYTPVSTTVTFARGQTTRTVTIPILSSGAGGSFRVILASPTDDAAVSSPASAAVTVPGRSPVSVPVLSALRISPSSFRPARHGATLARRSTHTGTAISYRDSQAATTVLTVRRSEPGIKRGRSCVARPRHVRGHPRRCTRILGLGSFTHRDVAGANRLRFTGRVRSRSLKRGRYRLVARPRSATGLSGRTVSARFRVL